MGYAWRAGQHALCSLGWLEVLVVPISDALLFALYRLTGWPVVKIYGLPLVIAIQTVAVLLVIAGWHFVTALRRLNKAPRPFSKHDADNLFKCLAVDRNIEETGRPTLRIITTYDKEFALSLARVFRRARWEVNFEELEDGCENPGIQVNGTHREYKEVVAKALRDGLKLPVRINDSQDRQWGGVELEIGP